MTDDPDKMKKLTYSIHKYSSFASSYVPENILFDKPHEQTSRWTSKTNYQPQYLVLKLESASILDSITFGKFEKTHVCNVKKFKVFGGITEKCNVELLESGLKNDTVPETFSLRATIEGHSVPCNYVKIMPLQCWGPSFNFSIWYVELTGTDDEDIVTPSLEWFKQTIFGEIEVKNNSVLNGKCSLFCKELIMKHGKMSQTYYSRYSSFLRWDGNTAHYQEKKVIRLCLKYFRQNNYEEAFTALQRQTNVTLEDQIITDLHVALLQRGSYEGVEQLMERAISEGYFKDFVNQQDYRPVWSKMPRGEEELRPGMRGGHQMCIDSYTETIYLFGGWDGDQDMNDFWSYHIPSHKWTLISKNTEADGGPSPRSCHKLCLDPERRQIFVLGRYIDPSYKSKDELKSDFFMYDIETNSWTLITEDTAHMGGPELIFDHQMCMDLKKRTIYVFGGRILTPPFGSNCPGIVGVTEVKYSGLYSYHVSTNTWTKLFEDCGNGIVRSGIQTLKSRAGHCMVFHPVGRKLYIFAGQRSKEFFNDFFTYDVDTGEIYVLFEGSKKDENVPGSGFTQRATINAELDEIYVLSGLSKEKDKRNEKVQSSFWLYSIKKGEWTCLHRNTIGDHYWSKIQRVEPCPRFAHQLVYDHINKVHYLFGGNPGRGYYSNVRLDDFWRLDLLRPTDYQLLLKFQFIIRKHRFEELAMQDSLNALNYLQTAVSDIVDHTDPQQTKEFQSLAPLLFQNLSGVDDSEQDIESLIHRQRLKLFNKLLEYFPTQAIQPKQNLTDLIRLTSENNETFKY